MWQDPTYREALPAATESFKARLAESERDELAVPGGRMASSAAAWLCSVAQSRKRLTLLYDGKQCLSSCRTVRPCGARPDIPHPKLLNLNPPPPYATQPSQSPGVVVVCGGCGVRSKRQAAGTSTRASRQPLTLHPPPTSRNPAHPPHSCVVVVVVCGRVCGALI